MKAEKLVEKTEKLVERVVIDTVVEEQVVIRLDLPLNEARMLAELLGWDVTVPNAVAGQMGQLFGEGTGTQRAAVSKLMDDIRKVIQRAIDRD